MDSTPSKRELWAVDYPAAVISLARRFKYRFRNIDIMDLLQAGMVGFLEAQRTFDPLKGASFDTHAWRRISGSMQDFIRGCYWWPRSKTAKKFGARSVLSLDGLVDASANSPGPDECLERDEMDGVLNRALSSISEFDWNIINMYYDQGLGLRHIGKVFGFGESWASYRLKEATEHLRREVLS